MTTQIDNKKTTIDNSVDPIVKRRSPLMIHLNSVIPEVFGILNITLSESFQVDYLDISATKGVLDSYLVKEGLKLSSLFDVCMSATTYVDIEKTKITITERKDFYQSVSTSLGQLMQSRYDSDNSCLACPTDYTLSISNNCLYVSNIPDTMLVWVNPINNENDLLQALICKFDYMAYVCDMLIKARMELSENEANRLKVFNNCISLKWEVIALAAQKAIEDKELKTPQNKDKYQNKVIKRINNGPFGSQVDNYLHKTNEFTKYIVVTESIDSTVLFDFVLDMEILRQLNCHALSYPWIKEEFYPQINDILNMIKEAYYTLTNPNIRQGGAEAYCIILLWMVDRLKIATISIKTSIPSYVLRMNKLLGEDYNTQSIQNSLSIIKKKKVTYESIFNIVDAYAYKFGIISL